MRTDAAIARSITVLAVLGAVAALYFARAIFLPLALAIPLTFLLAPVVRLLRDWGLPKAPAVVLVVLVSSTIILGMGALVAQQMTQLAQKLPEYQFNIETKIGSLRAAAGGGTLERISNFFRDINQEIEKKEKTPQAAQQPKEEPPKPMPVEIRQPEPTPVQVIRQILEPLVEPLTTAGLVVIFVIFFLVQRQDLRVA